MTRIRTTAQARHIRIGIEARCTPFLIEQREVGVSQKSLDTLMLILLQARFNLDFSRLAAKAFDRTKQWELVRQG